MITKLTDSHSFDFRMGLSVGLIAVTAAGLTVLAIVAALGGVS